LLVSSNCKQRTQNRKRKSEWSMKTPPRDPPVTNRTRSQVLPRTARRTSSVSSDRADLIHHQYHPDHRALTSGTHHTTYVPALNHRRSVDGYPTRDRCRLC